MRLAARLALFGTLLAGWSWAPVAQAGSSELSDEHDLALVSVAPTARPRVKSSLSHAVLPQAALPPPDSTAAPLTVSLSAASIPSPLSRPFSARAPPSV